MKENSNKISKKEIKHLSWLAKIELSKEEEELFSKQLNDILSYFRKIDEADVEKLSPTQHVVELINVMRVDKPEASASDEILRNVPKIKGRYVKAPRIV
jgi:aspartyl-tRNA(Asn)/glutamyl-tRNA(Gln) amidotransferase subunit C